MAAAGEVAAAVYNTNRGKESDPVLSAADFVPRALDAPEPDSEPEADADPAALAAFFRAVPKVSK
jgi:hypothetical protein